jgi:transglutaminase-like putative cysteine protease
VRYLIKHETQLAFPRPVREHQCELRLVPRDDAHQRVLSASVEVSPKTELGGYVDCYGNRVQTLSILEPHDFLVTTLHAEVETWLTNPFAFPALDPDAERAWMSRALREEPRLLDFVLHRSECVPELSKLAVPLAPPAFDPRRSLLENVQTTMEWAAAELVYESGVTDVHHPLAEVLEKRAGVCQDFAHLLVCVVRSFGFAARYAMGFLDPVYAARPEGDDAGSPVAATHAWAEVLVPGAGWRGFDATQQLVVNDTYVTVAVGRDSRDAAPLRGSFKGADGGEAPRVQVCVQRQD